MLVLARAFCPFSQLRCVCINDTCLLIMDGLPSPFFFAPCSPLYFTSLPLFSSLSLVSLSLSHSLPDDVMLLSHGPHTFSPSSTRRPGIRRAPARCMQSRPVEWLPTPRYEERNNRRGRERQRDRGDMQVGSRECVKEHGASLSREREECLVYPPHNFSLSLSLSLSLSPSLS